MKNTLVYIHIGSNIPNYIYDSIYQSLLINGHSCKIYLLIEDSIVDECKSKIYNFNLTKYYEDQFYFENMIEIIPLSILNDELFEEDNFKKYKNILTDKFKNMTEFRDGFWISTTARFFYIHTFMKIFNIKNVFHIENDVMIYKKMNFLYEYIKDQIKIEDIDRICMIQDAPNRVIPSLMFFPDVEQLYKLTEHITNTLEKSNVFINDMNLLGLFPNKYLLSIDPLKTSKTENVIFDGAAIGQYLGGVDTKNLPNSSENDMILINNPTKGFINETSTFKPNTCNFMKNTVHIDNTKFKSKVFSCYEKEKNKLFHIANLHIHSKQLHQFSSVLDVTYNDIISGDRILELCDFVILTHEIHHFHKNIEKYAKDILIIKDFNSVNYELLNKYIKEKYEKNKTEGRDYVNLFIYTHILDLFIKHIFPNLDKNIKYNFYMHNSDHDFNDTHIDFLNNNCINNIFAQNINTSKMYDKLSLLPLGIANSMWPHGNMVKIYNTIKDTYLYKKNKNIYVNINPATFQYRKILLDNIENNSNFKISKGKTFEEYLKELASHKFCLCIRGNGIDTHRFWESLYLGVIPVIINNKYTKCNTFVEYLKKQEIPFYEIKNDEIDFKNKYTNEFFDDKLYNKILNKYNNNYIYNIDCLKLNNYR